MNCKSVMLLPLMLLAVPQASADPLSDLLAKDGGAACFQRIYDDAHLARKPGQKTRSALLSLNAFPDGDGAIIRIGFQRTDGTLYIVGSCSFDPRPISTSRAIS